MKALRTLLFPLICLAFSFVQLEAAAQTFDWAKQLGSTDADEGTAIAVSKSGNVYSAGNFQDTMLVNPGVGTLSLISNGGTDVFISRLDSAGSFLWTKQIGGTGSEYCNAIAADGYGNIYITGTFMGIADFDPGPGSFNLTSSASGDAFICKLNASGNLVWVKQIGGGQSFFPEPVISNAIAVDDSGYVYTTGSFDGPADFDPGSGTFTLTPGLIGTTYTTDIFISKLDSSGSFVWAKQLGGTNFEAGYAIAVDSNSNIYTTGFFNGTVDFDPGIGSFNLNGPSHTTGLTDIYISKLDAAGNFAWAKQMGGGTGHAIDVDNAGNVYASGDHPGDTVTLFKVSPSGTSIWSKHIGASICFSLAVDDNYNLFITGLFHGTKDFDPGPGTYNLTSISGGDSYISKFDSAGNFTWAKQLGGTHNVMSKSLAVDGYNNVYTTGTLEGTADFDPASTTYNLTSLGSMDVFIHKLRPHDLSVKEANSVHAFNLYPNPTGGKFTIQFNKEFRASYLVLRNVMGQVIERQTLNSHDEVELEITLASGIYVLEVYNQNGQKAITRIMKN